MSDKKLAKRLSLIVGISFLAAGAVSLYFAYHLFGNDFNYRLYTAHTEGQILAMEAGDLSSGKIPGETVYYSPIVQFITENSDTIVFSSIMNTAFSDYYEPGEKVQVKYNPEKPTDAEIYEFLPMWGIFIVLIVLGVLGLAGGILLVRNYFLLR